MMGVTSEHRQVWTAIYAAVVSSYVGVMTNADVPARARKAADRAVLDYRCVELIDTTVSVPNADRTEDIEMTVVEARVETLDGFDVIMLRGLDPEHWVDENEIRK